MIEALFSIMKVCCKDHRAMILQQYIAEFGPIPDEYGQKIRQLLIAVEEEKMNEIIRPALTPEQKDAICYIIGEWYLLMKPLLEGQHNLGHMKERLKIMICGEER